METLDQIEGTARIGRIEIPLNGTQGHALLACQPQRVLHARRPEFQGRDREPLGGGTHSELTAPSAEFQQPIRLRVLPAQAPGRLDMCRVQRRGVIRTPIEWLAKPVQSERMRVGVGRVPDVELAIR